MPDMVVLGGSRFFGLGVFLRCTQSSKIDLEKTILSSDFVIDFVFVENRSVGPAYVKVVIQIWWDCKRLTQFFLEFGN